MDIPYVMSSFWNEIEGFLQYINRMEAAQKKSTSTSLLVTDAVMQTILFRVLLVSNEYLDDMREW